MEKENKKKSLLVILNQNKYLYAMLILPIIFYSVFCYAPMFGIVIAFQDYVPGDPWIKGATWVGLKNFKTFIESPFFFRLVKNNIVLNFWGLVFAFPAPIILALILNEVKAEWFKRKVQTIVYLPYFVALVIIAGITIDFVSTDGLINQLLEKFFGVSAIPFLDQKQYFRTIFITSGIWQGIGWGTIIYLAALTGVSPTLYEAADMDGVSRLGKIWHISLPAIKPTILILFILAVGSLMSGSFEKVLLLQRPATYEVSDIIETYVYRKGIGEAEYSFSTAVNVFSSVVNFILLFLANYMSKKYSEEKTSLF